MAQIYFGLTQPSFAQGSVFEVGVFLDTQGQQTAAIESSVQIPPGLELVDIRDGNSVVNLWLERPIMPVSPSVLGEDVVSFSGITPGGFVGDRGELFRLVLRAQDVGNMTISADKTQVLLNDGEGTAAEVIPAPISFTVTAEGEATTYAAPEDTEQPEPFTPMLLEQTDLGGWVVVFSTQDKISGIDHYEVREGWVNWRRATSPYLLEDQKLRHRITVKAVDRSGNERIAVVPATHPVWMPSGALVWSILAIIIGGGILFLFMRRLWKKSYPRQRRHR